MAEKCAVTHLLGASLVLKARRRKMSQVKGDFERLFQSIRSSAEGMSLMHCKTKHRLNSLSVSQLNLIEMLVMFVAF